MPALSGIAITAPECDAENNGRPYLSMLEDGVWSFDPAGPVTNVELAVAEANWTGLFPVDDDVAATKQCDSADYNDGVLFLEVDPAPSAKVLHLASGGIQLHGPTIEGFAELGSTSVLALATSTGSASLENLALHAVGPALIATGDMAISIDAFHVRLWDRVSAIVDARGESLTIEPGRARFAASASVFGESSVRTATNTTPILITKQPSGWHTSAFSIDHSIGEEQWTLVIEPARWQ